MERVFFELAVVLALAGSLAVLARVLKQPAILAYILAGGVIGSFGYLAFDSKEVLEVMSRLGIALLLFLVGMEMNVSRFRQVGRVALIAGFGQIIFTAAVGFFIAELLGFGGASALYIAAALAFSSTIIVVKLLSEKKDLKSLHGQIAVGILLAQDFVALLALVFLAGAAAGGGLGALGAALAVAKGGALFFLVFLLGKRLLPILIRYLARSEELLFLSSLAWAIGVAYVFSSAAIGLSLEIGGFLAGLTLSFSAEHFRIYSRVRPLRDFFVVILFVVLGATLALGEISGPWLSATIIFSLFVLIGTPLIILVLMGFLGYGKRVSFLTGLSLAQVSEFSFILVQLGNRAGHISGEIVSLTTAVGVVTIAVSSYFIIFGNKIYSFFAPLLSFFEKRAATEEAGAPARYRDHIILVGAHRLGQHLLGVLPKEKTVIVDFDPEVVRKLKGENFHVLYGDIADGEVEDKINISEAKLVISTVPDLEDNLHLLKRVKGRFFKSGAPKILATAEAEWEAKVLYEEGADYVIQPHLIGGEMIAELLRRDHNLAGVGELRRRDLATMLKPY